MNPTAQDKTFHFNGCSYHFRREFIEGKWCFAVFCGDEQVLHPEISTTVSDSKEIIAEFDREHGRSAYEAFAYEHLMNTITHIIPLADKRWKAFQAKDGS